MKEGLNNDMDVTLGQPLVKNETFSIKRNLNNYLRLLMFK
jgi:hypothetical protein